MADNFKELPVPIESAPDLLTMHSPSKSDTAAVRSIACSLLGLAKGPVGIRILTGDRDTDYYSDK